MQTNAMLLGANSGYANSSHFGLTSANFQSAKVTALCSEKVHGEDTKKNKDGHNARINMGLAWILLAYCKQV